jgi:hypothetical protein
MEIFGKYLRDIFAFNYYPRVLKMDILLKEKYHLNIFLNFNFETYSDDFSPFCVSCISRKKFELI